MKQLQVPFLLLAGDTILNVIAETLDGVASHKIDVTPWRGNESKPEARFAIAYGPENIFLKYYVIESNPRAVYTKPNDPVYKDSCVEFFIALEEDDNYYNFEFNFLGNVLVGYGAGAKDRMMLPVTLVKKIKAQTVLR